MVRQAVQYYQYREFLYDCCVALDDLLSPEFDTMKELASPLGEQLFKESMRCHSAHPQVIAILCRMLRKLVSLEPAVADRSLVNGLMHQMVTAMNEHMWSPVVCQSAADALVAIIPRKLTDACALSESGVTLVEVLRENYGRLKGAHLACGIMKAVVQAEVMRRNNATGRGLGWGRKNSVFGRAEAEIDTDDEARLFLLRQRLGPLVEHVQGLVNATKPKSTFHREPELAVADREYVPREGRTKVIYAHHDQSTACMCKYCSQCCV